MLLLPWNQGLSYYWNTMPKGIGVVEFRYLSFPNGVESFFSPNGLVTTPFNSSFNINKDLAKNVPNLKSIFDFVKGLDEQTYDQLSLGKFHYRGRAKIDARVVGLAYALNSKQYVYVGVPIFNVHTQIQMDRTQESNQQVLASLLEEDSERNQYAPAKTLISIVKENTFPQIDIQILQSITTNYFNFKPIGNWTGKNLLGDIELGTFLQLSNTSKFGSGLKNWFGPTYWL